MAHQMLVIPPSLPLDISRTSERLVRCVMESPPYGISREDSDMLTPKNKACAHVRGHKVEATVSFQYLQTGSIESSALLRSPVPLCLQEAGRIVREGSPERKKETYERYFQMAIELETRRNYSETVI